jgi:release factor glutamine methyltransferase
MNLQDLQKQVSDSVPGPLTPGESRTLAKIILGELTGNNAMQLLQEESFLLPDHKTEQLNRWISELAGGKPIQYVIGKAWFMELELLVNPAVLIPRPETEELVDLIVRNESGAQIFLDIGTGSGCIALAIKKRLPHSEVFATDISKEALETARENAAAHNLDISFIEHNMTEAPGILPDKIDVLVSNPPYVRPSEQPGMTAGVIDFEPHTALFTPDDSPLYFYEAIRSISLSRVVQGGRIYLEVNQKLSQETAGLFSGNSFSGTQILKDLSGNPRFVVTTRC